MGGKKFQRQFPLRFEYQGCKRFFVADFYCHEARLVIEVDGPVHERQCDYDEMRTAVLQTIGIHVVRITNEEINNNLESVLKKISNYL